MGYILIDRDKARAKEFFRWNDILHAILFLQDLLSKKVFLRINLFLSHLLMLNKMTL